jgi:hypothetical protein
LAASFRHPAGKFQELEFEMRPAALTAIRVASGKVHRGGVARWLATTSRDAISEPVLCSS